MYKYNVKAVLALYSLFILVILCVLTNSCLSPKLEELASPKRNTFEKILFVSPSACDCAHFVHHYDVSYTGVESSLIEFCIDKYDIKYDSDVGVLVAPGCENLFPWPEYYRE